MKKFLTILLTVVLTAAVAITGTVAYLTAEDSDVNTMTFGDVRIDQHEFERVVKDGKYTTIDVDGTTSYELQEFTQNKPLYPIVGDPNSGYDSTTVRLGQLGHNSRGGMDILTPKNVQDKFVVVENTGLSDAYVRTVVAFEAGSLTYAEWNELINYSFHFTWKEIRLADTVVEIGGNNYVLVEFVYNGYEDVQHPKGVLPQGDYTYNSLAQVYLKSEATRKDCEALDGNGNGKYDILVFSQAVQVNGFEEYGAEKALDTAFGDVTANNHPWLEATYEEVGSKEALENALKDTDASTIIVSLTEDVVYDVAAWQNDAMGGEETKTIVINGNGHTIDFNQTNSDWNNIVTNGAKLVINNAKLTNSGHNDGPWNRHDLNFACDVELNNVTSDKAFAFKAGATLNNVTINDANTSDTYAIWIQPNGQTVTLNNVVIDMLACTDGRGIKIDEQYVSDPEKVTLVVKNTTFKTEEKSAILVKSVAGADITVENVDITNVAADSTNAVWVDEASKDYAHLVKVTGANKIVEP